MLHRWLRVVAFAKRLAERVGCTTKTTVFSFVFAVTFKPHHRIPGRRSR